ncbi:hypothetical protein [Pseudomonas aeruginosa]|uniref:hypothetical protein n=1 Tax=Pseudomonas aeruginosa TaxID=287 RepID=UPI0011511E5D|nr:hypothetical protein [Pseudomonas aeruginosa]TQH45582.1 hypothetical protein FLI59_33480 [Pseudomonas aeruginosa]
MAKKNLKVFKTHGEFDTEVIRRARLILDARGYRGKICVNALGESPVWDRAGRTVDGHRLIDDDTIAEVAREVVYESLDRGE